MAKKDKQQEAEEKAAAKKDKKPVEKVDDSQELAKLLVKEFNKGQEAGKIAWSLAYDSDNPTDVKQFLSTGSSLLDYIISNRVGGGVPVGKLTEFTGEEASGKSLICAHLIADCQRKGGIAVYIDVENSANPDFLERLGVNIKELVYLQPGTCEQVGDAIVKAIVMARARAPNKIILIVWDSIAATPTELELSGNFEISMDMQLAKSKVLGKMMRMITETVGKENVCLVFTNQLRTKIGVTYGDPMTAPGGKAVPFHSSVRVRLYAGAKKEKNNKAKDIYGIHTSAKVIKNRLGPPWRKCEFDVLFAHGVDDEGSWFQCLHERDEILKKNKMCYLTSFPSGEIETDGVDKGKDLGVAFQEFRWKKLLADRPDVKEHVMKLLQKHMVVSYGEKPKDAEIDIESAMEVETIFDQVTGEVLSG